MTIRTRLLIGLKQNAPKTYSALLESEELGDFLSTVQNEMIGEVACYSGELKRSKDCPMNSESLITDRIYQAISEQWEDFADLEALWK